MDINSIEFKILKCLIEKPENLEILLQSKITSEYFLQVNKSLFGFILKYYSRYKESLTRENFSIVIDTYPTTLKNELLSSFESAINTVVDAEFQFLLDALQQAYKARLYDETIQKVGYFYRENNIDQGIVALKEGLAKIETVDIEQYTSRDIKEDIDRMVKTYDNFKNGIRDRVVYSGFPTIDVCSCGFGPGELIIFQGPMKSGKSSLALNVGYNIWANNGNILFISAEMSEKEVRLRLAAMNSNLRVNAIRMGELSSEEEVVFKNSIEAIKNKQNSFIIVDCPAISTTAIKAEIDKMQRTTQVDLVIVDYLALVTPVSTKWRTSWEKSGAVALELRTMGKVCKCPILSIHQFTKEGVKKRSNNLEDGEGLDVAKHADVIVGLRMENPQEQGHNPITALEGKVVGNRKGDVKSFKLSADFQFSQIRETV